MEELKELKKRLSQKRPAQWRDLPDLGLYMDQVMSYLPSQLISYSGEDKLTPAMVNNYIKDGLLPRAEGKKYGRSHLAYLTAISALKQVLSVKETKVLLQAAAQDQDVWGLYAKVWGELDLALEDTADTLDPDLDQDDLAGLALRLALRSYADKLACQRILGLLEPEPQVKPEKGKAKK